MIEIVTIAALILFVGEVVGGSTFWNYYTCKQKFPHVAWYVCVLSK